MTDDYDDDYEQEFEHEAEGEGSEAAQEAAERPDVDEHPRLDADVDEGPGEAQRGTDQATVNAGATSAALVQLHGRHRGRTHVLDRETRVDTIVHQRHGVDVGAVASRLAAVRVREFRAFQVAVQEEIRQEESAWVKTRKETRGMNKAMHRSLGVADKTPKQRLQALLHQQRVEKQRLEKQADLERKQRWYNARPPSRYSATVAAAQVIDAMQQERAERKRCQRQRQRRIEQNQRRVQAEAKRVAAACSTAYVRGSYILKLGEKPRQRQASTKGNTQSDALASTAQIVVLGNQSSVASGDSMTDDDNHSDAPSDSDDEERVQQVPTMHLDDWVVDSKRAALCSIELSHARPWSPCAPWMDVPPPFKHEYAAASHRRSSLVTIPAVPESLLY